MKPKASKKKAFRACRVVKKGTAAEAIGTIEKGTDTYILTYGQFSLIDALSVILDQTGPADVVISSWTAAEDGQGGLTVRLKVAGVATAYAGRFVFEGLVLDLN